ncbi:MAG TPA: P-loop NTPase, partial [Clostridia bacterium]
MIDQADKLRQIITFLKQKQADTQNEISQNGFVKKTSRVITVTSGKGGVGKTNISINLAIALNEAGYRVVILDADLGLANIDVLFGLVSKNSLLEVLHNEKNILEVLTQGPGNIKFVSGGSGVEELVKLDRAQIEKFIENISLLDKIADIV